MSILKNAVDSIAIGLEDYSLSESDQRRIISCTRNIFAGILLLFKYKLSLLSPAGSDEALIKQKVLPALDIAGSLIWVGKGGKTVDVQNIRDRFDSLGIEVDWKRLEKISDFRNEIEHYYSNLKHDAVRSLISDSFVIIRDFVSDYLNQDPKALLGDESWLTLIQVNEVYQREKDECDRAIEGLEFYSDKVIEAVEAFSCDECGSGLIVPTNDMGKAYESEFLCKSCGTKFTYESIVNLAVSKYYDFDVYLSHTDGGDSPITDCPLCIDGIYLYEEGICSSCGYEAEHKCQRCGSAITPAELSQEPFCGYCLHVMSKDD